MNVFFGGGLARAERLGVDVRDKLELTEWTGTSSNLAAGTVSGRVKRTLVVVFGGVLTGDSVLVSITAAVAELVTDL